MSLRFRKLNLNQTARSAWLIAIAIVRCQRKWWSYQLKFLNHPVSRLLKSTCLRGLLEVIQIAGLWIIAIRRGNSHRLHLNSTLVVSMPCQERVETRTNQCLKRLSNRLKKSMSLRLCHLNLQLSSAPIVQKRKMTRLLTHWDWNKLKRHAKWTFLIAANTV